MQIRLIVLAVLMLTGGCASSSPLPALTLSSADSVYRLAGGDMVKIMVFGEQRLTGTYAINGQGKVDLPLIGEIDANKKTVGEFQEAVRAALADGFINNPSVSVEVANYRPYYILGEVAKPGEFSFADGLTVYAAVARAGGYTYRADQQKVFIRHKGEPAESVYRVDGATPVQPGDTVRVTERSF